MDAQKSGIAIEPFTQLPSPETAQGVLGGDLKQQESENPSAVTWFDPASGCQIASTGLLGGFFIVSLAAAFGVFQTLVLPGGGPRVAEIFTWFPHWFPANLSFTNVSRNFYDISAFVVLGFLFMVNWEFLRHKAARLYMLGVSAAATWASWKVALGATWFFPSETAYHFYWTWTRMEVVYGCTVVGLLVPWAIYLAHPKTNFVVSPIAWAFRSAFCRWLSGLAVFTAFLFVTFEHPFYQNNYFENWRIACGYLYSLYLFLGLPYGFITNLLRGHKFENRSDPEFVLLLLFRRGLRVFFGLEPRRVHWHIGNRRIGVALRDLGVKIFFIPLMVTFLYMECGGLFSSLVPFWHALTSKTYWYTTFSLFYRTGFHAFFVVDVSLALIGYASSSRWLDNKSKSVEPTMVGWFVTLICYPPFNGITTRYLPYDGMAGGAPYGIFQPTWVDALLKTFALIFYAVYVWATTAFGLRFSNLTNRGIITRGPYAFIRHPAYIMKNLAWWCEKLRSFGSPWQFIFLAAWNYIYYQRAKTEERHLSADPDYVAYCQHVRYRFIPGIW
jgi:protein-S-isoprenylcysteine O-methyltransferase Ste14